MLLLYISYLKHAFGVMLVIQNELDDFLDKFFDEFGALYLTRAFLFVFWIVG